MSLLLVDTLPALTRQLEAILAEEGHLELSAQVRGLQIVDRCRCGDDFCATFYTRPRPDGACSSDLTTIPLAPKEGMLILDVVDHKIACVEVLFRDEIRKALHEALP
jgi:hypothetical protein